MKYYAYRLEGGGLHCLEERGVGGLVPEDHLERLRQLSRIEGKDSLYCEIGEVSRPDLVKTPEIPESLAYSPSSYLQIQMVKRLYAARDQWSRHPQGYASAADNLSVSFRSNQ